MAIVEVAASYGADFSVPDDGKSKEDKMKCPACKHEGMTALLDVSTDAEDIYRCYYCGRIVRAQMAKVICMDCKRVYRRIPSATITETHGLCPRCLKERRAELVAV